MKFGVSFKFFIQNTLESACVFSSRVPTKIEDLDVPLVESGQAMTMLTSLLHVIQNFIPLYIYIYIYIYTIDY